MVVVVALLVSLMEFDFELNAGIFAAGEPAHYGSWGLFR